MFSTFNDLLDINGNINIDGSQITYTSSTNELKFANNAQLRFGGANDLRIYFDGSNSVIQDAGVGDLFLAGDNALRITDSSFTETKALFNTNGSVELYYDAIKKFETTGAGVTVFGTTESQQLNVSGVSTFQSHVYLGDSDNLYFGDGEDMRILHNGN